LGQPINHRIDDLKRPAQEYPRRFVPLETDLGDWGAIEPLCQRLLERPIASKTDLEEWLVDGSEFGAVIGEESSRRYIRMTCATDDEGAKKAYLHFVEEILPKLKPFEFQSQKRLLDSPYTGELDAGRYGIMLRATRNAVELFRDENIPLETELDRLSQQYQEIQGSLTVQFRGEERTLQQMGVFLEEKDRSTRQEAWEVTTRRRLEVSEQLETIFDKMLELRLQIARNAGFDNYRDYQFRRYNRFDYTPADCFEFHQAVEQHVVPLTRAALDERRRALGIDSVRPWDVACDRFGRTPLKPFDGDDRLAFGCKEIFTSVDPRLGAQFDRMIDLGLLDLGSRKGKAPGGYQSTLSEVRLPFIFMNAVGLNRDVMTLLHEGGHAFHALAAADQFLLDYRHSPMEFAEVASMSMEHLGAPYLEVFYSSGEAARARRDHYESDVTILPWIAIIDAFQHWIYTHPGHSRDERAEAWVGLMNRFGAGVDWSGLEEGLRYRWHAQLHIFEYPFYYIEYGIALLGALQIWRNAMNDRRGAVDAYLKGLALGGSKPLPELFSTAGAKFDFSAATIAPLMNLLQEEMTRQGAMESK